MGDIYFDTYLDALYLDVDKKGFGVIKFLEYKKINMKVITKKWTNFIKKNVTSLPK